MSGIKKLAGQTLWYGVSSIAARFLNYLLTPYLTDPSVLKGSAYGELSLVFAVIPFLNVIFTYGLETAYFRYSKNREHEKQVFNTSMVSLIVSTLIFTIILLLYRHQLASLIGVQNHPEYFTWSAFIIAFDALSSLAFAKVRYEGRPIKYATVRIAGILINIGLTVFFLSVCPSIQKSDPNGFIGTWYRKDFGVGYVLIATFFQSLLTAALFIPVIKLINTHVASPALIVVLSIFICIPLYFLVQLLIMKNKLVIELYRIAKTFVNAGLTKPS
ncbi:MAG: lipopolysaccharide biosynthesis protein [Flavisolibacter sp.]